ncbi:MAG: hypothetical protein WCJ56_13995 [bacterium]
MIDRRAEVILLCEDKAHQSFFRRLLKNHFKFQNVRIIPVPDGKGAGEQHVRKKYPVEVSVVRKGHVTRLLVTVIDADAKSVEKHYDELNAELVKTEQNMREKGDPIAIFIPKHHIETWIVCLSKKVKVSEKENYKREVQECDMSKAVEQFFSLALLAVEQRPAYCPDSLTRAFSEMERLRKK